MKRNILPLCLLFILGGLAQDVFCQSVFRTQLFSEADQLLSQAKEKHADFYAPSTFEKGMRFYNEANEDFTNDRQPEDIREKLKNASLYFAKALDACTKGELAFRSTMTAHNDANSAGAPQSVPELWNKAEELFKRAARRLEEGNTEDARKTGGESEAVYRSAELEAVKANFLSPARELLRKADETGVKESAPNTLAKAHRFASFVEELLKRNRYDTDSARQLAQEAKYEAAHAIYLHSVISQLKKQDKSFEDVIIESELQFQRVAGSLGLQSRFDNGYDTPVAEALSAIKMKDVQSSRYADSLRQLGDIIKGKNSKIDNLSQQVAEMEKRVGASSDAEKQLQEAGKELEYRLALQLQQEKLVKQTAATFTDEEGNLIRDGENIIIRLYGLSFAVGKSTIESQHYPLLSKVQNTIKKFPNCRVTIEGHTDSQGGDDLNQTLSEGRAKAVAEYLMANMNVQIPINSQGYGESRPIASNDTPEGKAKNRRIDVVITPEWAAAGK